MLRTLALVFALMGLASVGSASPREDLLVTPAWLAHHLNDPDLVLLHVGDKGEFASAHIPGARFVEMQDVSVTGAEAGGLTLELPKAEDLRKRLAALGVSDRSRIVVYYGKDWVSPSTRIVFTLDAAGLGGRTSVLDGGMGAWTHEGHPVTAKTAPARTGTLSALKMQPRVVDAAFVRSHLNTPGFAVIDARAQVFYDGVQPGGPRDKRTSGHAAGAHSLPFTEVTGDDLKFKSPEALAALFVKAGVKPGDTIVAYCHVGQQATAVVFAARTLGRKVYLYDGSFEDWARRGLPVDNPSRKGQ